MSSVVDELRAISRYVSYERNLGSQFLFSLGSRTAYEESELIDVATKKFIYLNLEINGASGTSPTLDIGILGKTSNGTAFFGIGSFSQKTGVGSDHIFIENPPSKIKGTCSIGGSLPLFFFQLDADLF